MREPIQDGPGVWRVFTNDYKNSIIFEDPKTASEWYSRYKQFISSGGTEEDWIEENC